MHPAASQRALSDWTLVAAVGVGVFFPWAFALVFLAVLLRAGAATKPLQLHTGHMLQLASIVWGLAVIASRGVGDARALLLQFAFLWTVPLLLALYRPDDDSVRRYTLLIGAIFVVDLLFNLFAFATDRDLLNRAMDARSGLAGGRFGGLFAHSFYSGSISILAYVAVLGRKRGISRWGLALLPVGNLLLAGSWRLLVAIVLVPLLLWGYRRRSSRAELALVGLLSLALVVLVVLTSSLFDLGPAVEPNPSNDLRIGAWLTALDKIIESPWTGVGYPSDKPPDGIDLTSIDDLLITESWYLGAMVTFGVPYALLRLCAYLMAFYRGDARKRAPMEAMMVPFVLVDLTYGGFFEGALVYVWVWLLIGAREGADTAPGPSRLPHSPLTGTSHGAVGAEDVSPGR